MTIKHLAISGLEVVEIVSKFLKRAQTKEKLIITARTVDFDVELKRR